MKETYEKPDFEMIELEDEITATNVMKDSNESDIVNMDLE